MDGVLGFLLGLFLGGLLGFFVAALIIANGREVEPEPGGVDGVLDELMKTVKSQPKHYYSEERMEDFKQKYPQE